MSICTYNLKEKNINSNEYYEKINNMFNADTLFLHKETIYKVK